MKQPKQIKSIWDNGGETLDRYVVVLKGEKLVNAHYACIYSCHQPTHSLGVSGWDEALEGDHLGERIKWADLPVNVQEFVINQLK